MFYTETKLFPWHCAQISKAVAKLVTFPLVVATQVWVTFIDVNCPTK